MPDTVVPVALLEALARQLLDHVREVEGESVALDVDYFWSIPFDVRFDPSTRPTDLTIGQLSENLDNLRQMQDDEATLS